ncbi:MAG: acyltransferase, partial [Rhizobacter sp.]|nr:acyltransferase [Chlorobiales bacterium]
FRHDKTKIVIGEKTYVRGELLLFGHGGEIHIGHDCYIGAGTRIWSAARIDIGNHVLIAHNVNIHDNISHPANAALRRQHSRNIIESGHPKDGLNLNEKPVSIHDNAWIGFNATILKGVTIGEGAIIGACSVITKDVPAWTIVAGNPAKIIRELPESER